MTAMFTTLVSLFLSVFGALRAAPLYYSRILTIGSTIWASLGDGTATIGTLPGVITSTPVFRLPPSHVVPTLPARTSTQYLGASLALLLAVSTTTLVLSGIIWRLRALSLAPGHDDMHAGNPEKIRHTIIDFSGVTYNGNMITSDVDLAGLFAGSTDPSTPFQHETPAAPSERASPRQEGKPAWPSPNSLPDLHSLFHLKHLKSRKPVLRCNATCGGLRRKRCRYG